MGICSKWKDDLIFIKDMANTTKYWELSGLPKPEKGGWNCVLKQDNAKNNEAKVIHGWLKTEKIVVMKCP